MIQKVVYIMVSDTFTYTGRVQAYIAVMFGHYYLAVKYRKE